MNTKDNPAPNLGYTGPALGQTKVCKEIYDYLVIKKLQKLQQAVIRLNSLIKEIAR